MSEIHPIFDKYNSLSFWGRAKRMIKGLIGLMFLIPFFCMTVFFLLMELGNYIWDIVFGEHKHLCLL